LDNILLTPDGKFFHIDFGWILERDPKPFPPPMKLCAEMVLGMGGARSERYKRFILNCCTAYNILRKRAKLILNLFLLMIDAGIPHIDKGVIDLLKVQDRLKLSLSNEEATIFIRGVISDSDRALFGQVHDIVHRWSGYWKR